VTASSAAASPRLRLAALGCGRVFERFHLPALLTSPDWELTAAVDPAGERLRWISGLRPGIAAAASLAELGADVHLDAVLVSSPPDTHCALGSEGLRRGAHALIEKPMALRPSEAASLLALARERGRQVWVGYNRRFRPAYLQLRERVRQAGPDRIRDIACDLYSTPLGWGAVSGYLTVPERGGDLLDDLASHQLDLVPWIVGRPVEEVRARFLRRDAHEVLAAIELRFAGGLVGRCRAGHGAGALERLQVRLDDRVLLASPAGSSAARRVPRRWVERYLALRTTLGNAGRRLGRRPGYTVESFAGQLAAWAGAIRGGGASVAADGAAGARCVELVEACRHSLAVGGAWVAAPAGRAS